MTSLSVKISQIPKMSNAAKLWLAIIGLAILWIISIIVISVVLSVEIKEVKSYCEKMEVDKTTEEVPVKDNEQIISDICRYGSDSCSPAASCHAIIQRNPHSISGYYWLLSSTGELERVYCNMDNTCSKDITGWRRIANYDFQVLSSILHFVSGPECPDGWCAGVGSCYPCLDLEPCKSIRIAVNESISELCANIVFTITEFHNRTGAFIGTVTISHGNQTVWSWRATVGEFAGMEKCGSLPSLEINGSPMPLYCFEYEAVPVEFGRGDVVMEVCLDIFSSVGAIEVSRLEFFIN